MEDTERQLAETDRADTRQKLQSKVDDLQERLREAESRRDSLKVKHLWTPEIREKLWEAIKTAQERLLILSGWISSRLSTIRLWRHYSQPWSAVPDLDRVWIRQGRTAGAGATQSFSLGRRRKCALADLRREYADQFVSRDIHTHEKRLICDNRFTFGGSFNLLHSQASGEDGAGSDTRVQT